MARDARRVSARGTTEDTETTKTSFGDFEPAPWHVRLLRWLITTPETQHDDTLGRVRQQRISRNYQVWGSDKQLFFLGGRFRITRAEPIVAGTFGGILIPCVFFSIFDAAWCWHHIHPAAVVVFYYCWAQCLVSFVKAASSDPGVVPRNVHLTEDPYNLPEEYFSTISLPAGTRSERSVDVRYCSTCRSWRMPRSFHCSKCDECVSIHDHHCKWLNNCVGERNYRFFFTFLLFASISASYVIAMAYYRLLHSGSSLKHVPMTLVNLIISHFMLAYPLLLLVYHVYLCGTGQTTREYLRAFRNNVKRVKPFTFNSVAKNFVYSLCKPRGISYVRRRGEYEPGDLRFERFDANCAVDKA